MWKKDSLIFNNNPIFPSSLRMVIIGHSNCGKTYRLLQMILDEFFEFERIIICSQSLFQTDYQILIKCLQAKLHLSQIKEFFKEQTNINNYEKAIDQLAKNNKNKSKIEIITYENPNNLPHPSKFVRKKSLIILDDVLIADQSQIEVYFTQSRHSGFNIIYLSQSYFKLNRHIIRTNANFYMFFKLNKIDIENIWRDLASIDFPDYHIFEELMKNVFKAKYDFFTINLETKRYTSNFKDINMEQEITARAIKNNNAYQAQRENMKLFAANKIGVIENLRKAEEDLKPVVDATKEANIKLTEGANKLSKRIEDLTTKTFDNVIPEKSESDLQSETTDDLSEENITFPEIVLALSDDKEIDLFSLVKRAKRICFPLYEFILEQTSLDFCKKYHIEDNKHDISFNMDNNTIIVDISDQSIKVDNSKTILKLLTNKDIPVIKLQKDINDYSKIIDFTVGSIIRSLYRNRKANDEMINKLLKYLDDCPRFVKIIRPNIRMGHGVKTFVKPPKIIVVPNNITDQVDRLMVILGSKTAGSTADSFSEFTAILDTLLKDGKINIKVYRQFLKKYHAN